MATKEKQGQPGKTRPVGTAPRKAAPAPGKKQAVKNSGTRSVKKQAPANRRPAEAPAVRKTRAPRTESREKQRSAARVQQAAADVVYLPPKPFNRNRLLLRLATVTAVVLALLFGISIFFKVENIVVSGTEKYTPWDISQAAEILGDNLLTFNRAEAAGKIQLKLPYVDRVRIGIKLPDTVKIDIVEIEVTYAIRDEGGAWWCVSSGGKVVEKALTGAEDNYTKLLGVRLDKPEAGQQAVALEPEQKVDGEGNPIPVTVTAGAKLQTALEIAQYLEQYGIIGKAASIDVEEPGKIRLWYEQRYQVELGDNTQLSHKIQLLDSVINQSGKYESGILDISLTKSDGVIFNEFDNP